MVSMVICRYSEVAVNHLCFSSQLCAATYLIHIDDGVSNEIGNDASDDDGDPNVKNHASVTIRAFLLRKMHLF